MICKYGAMVKASAGAARKWRFGRYFGRESADRGGSATVLGDLTPTALQPYDRRGRSGLGNDRGYFVRVHHARGQLDEAGAFEKHAPLEGGRAHYWGEAQKTLSFFSRERDT